MPVLPTVSMETIFTRQILTFVRATHPDYSQGMHLFASNMYLSYLPRMMNHLFLQTSNLVATTVDTRFASAYGTMRGETGPVEPSDYILLSYSTDDINPKYMEEMKKGDDNMRISCSVHTHASLYL